MLRESHGVPGRQPGRLAADLQDVIGSLCGAWGRSMAFTEDEVATAEERGRVQRRATPTAVAARFDAGTGRIVVRLITGLDVSFPPGDAQGLQAAAPDELEPIEISPSGFGLHFPKLDADLYLPALLNGYLGSERWMAARMGMAGGKARSEAKQAASRANGRLGGRPRKVAEAG